MIVENYSYKEVGLSANPTDISHAVSFGTRLIGYKKDKDEAHAFVEKANTEKWSVEKALNFSITGKH